MKPQVIVILATFVAVGAAIGISHVKTTQQQAAQQAAVGAAGPPAGAAFLKREIDELAVMHTGISNRHAPNETAPGVSEFANYWIAEPGWEGVVEQMTDEENGVALRWQKTHTSIIGGAYWVIVVLPQKDERVKVGTRVWVQGRIDNADCIMSGASPTPVYRVIVKDARVLSVQ